jgi:hypothetical protein
MSEKKLNDTLKQLEKLLADDAKNIGDSDNEYSLSKRDLTGIVIRVSISLVLILILYFSGIFERPIYVSLAILFIVGIEFIRYIKGRKYRANHFE